MVAISLIGLATWALSHSYQGIFHDGRIYALEALARVHPASLSNDVFLRFGSQDQFSVFGLLYSYASRWWGLSSAAASLTLVFQGAFIVGAWCLARTFATPALATLGTFVVLAIPAHYGSNNIFECMESYLTPRMPAEAFALAALAAALSSRQWLAIGLMIVATLLHPIMAAAAMALFYVLYLGLPHPRWALAGVGCGVAVYCTLLAMLHGPVWGRFDPTWFALVEARSPYLFLTNWAAEDWAPVTVAVATLVMSVLVPANTTARSVALAALVTVALGFAFAWLGGDWLHLVLPTQAQPWRWQWLGTVLAALMLPQLLTTLWHQQAIGRASALSIVAAWIFSSVWYAIVAAAAAVAATFLMHRLKRREARWIYAGAWGLVSIAAAWRLASNLEFTDAHYLELTVPLWIRRATSFVHDGTVPLALIGGTWYLAQRRQAPALVAIAVSALLFCAALLPRTWTLWTTSEFSDQAVQQFAPMREQVPPGADVFWPEAPVSAWALLNAPNYLSVAQTSGMVFSRASAVELDRRAAALAAFISPKAFLDWDSLADNVNLSRPQLAAACATGEFHFVVTHVDLQMPPVADVPTGNPARNLHLYRCGPPSG